MINLGRGSADNPYSYYKLSDLSRTNQVEILMRTNQGLQNIELPENMLKNIAKFLREDSQREEKFDCASFAHLANGIPYEFAKFEPEKWDINKLETEESLKSGDTIFIANTDNPDRFTSREEITHFAIYLGDKVYLSKFGNKGKLIVGSLDEMKKGFSGAHTFQTIPR